MATLTVQNVTDSGLVPATPVAVASGGDQFPNDGRTFVWLQNNHATDPRTFTVVTQKTVRGLAVGDRTVAITAAQDNAIAGPFDPEVYNDVNGMVQMTYSDSGADMKALPFRAS